MRHGIYDCPANPGTGIVLSYEFPNGVVLDWVWLTISEVKAYYEIKVEKSDFLVPEEYMRFE